MKKLLLMLAIFGLTATTIFAQSSGSAAISTGATTTTTTAKTAKAAPAKYICPKCMASSDKPGTCAKCHATLVKEGMYYCPGCGATSTKAGKCTKCNMDMKLMTASSK